MNTRFMKAMLLSFPLLSLAVPASFANEAVKEPKVVAVKFHADWCGSCRKMGTAFEDLRNKFDGKPVLFVNLDKTNISTAHHSELLASALGLKEIYAANPGTGFILLVDTKTRKELKKLSPDLDLKAMSSSIAQLVEK